MLQTIYTISKVSKPRKY